MRFFWRGIGLGLIGLSLFGFLNGFVFRIHGPAFDLGVVAGALGLAVLWASIGRSLK